MIKKEKLGVGIAMSMGIMYVSLDRFCIQVSRANNHPNSAGIMATIKTASLNKLASGDSCEYLHPHFLPPPQQDKILKRAGI
jgi:hypothetical protein